MNKHAVGRISMISTGNPLAAEAASHILGMGGSAVDAAIAADAVLGVVEPMATGVGGDLLAMIVSPRGEVVSYNGTGRAPAALSLADIEKLPGRRISERHPLSVTVPGAVRGWQDLHVRYGRIEWSLLFEKAISIARHGFAVAPVAAREWLIFEDVLRDDPCCARLYMAGRIPKAGGQFSNPELAMVLESIAYEGVGSFYQGKPARAAAQAVQEKGGVLAEEDFRSHEGNYCSPVSTFYRGVQVHQCPPNSHGVAVLDALAQVELGDVEPGSPDEAVCMVNAMSNAMERASRTVADPSGNTVCTVIVDAQGLAITLMTSIFKRFGSGIAVPGSGFVLQNRGFGFAVPGHVNAPAPGKRPYHTVIPGAATCNGRFLLGLGVVGGLMQPQGQLQVLTRLLAGRQPLQKALDAPRWRLEAGNALAIEAGMPVAVERALRAAGYPAPATNVGELAGRSDFGGAQVVMRNGAGLLEGASDRRKDGVSRGE